MNKKGQFEIARKTIYWMIAGLVITIVVLGFAIIIASYQNKITAVPGELRAELMVLRFANNDNCFAYQDKESGRVFPGVIDLNRFNEEVLNGCYLTEEKEGFESFNYRLELVGEKKTLLTNNYFHKDDFTLFKQVLVKKESGLVKDELRIYVQEKI